MKWISDRLAGILTLPGTRRAAAAVRASLVAAGDRSDFRIFAIVFLLLLSFRIVLIVTYPLNLAHDSDNYLNMILGHGSSLVHAGGYPFLVNVLFLWHHFPDPTSPVLLYVLQIAQHAIELLTLVALYFCLADLFNNWVAGLAVLIVGMDIDAAAFTNASTPEWL